MRLGLIAAFVLLLGGVGCAHGNDERAGDRWKVVFPASRDGEWATYAVNPDGTGRVRIAQNDGPGFAPPVRSRDGRKLILPGSQELRVVEAGRTGWRRLASGAPSTAAWSPDGKQVVFNGLSPGLSLIDADGEDGRRLTRNRGDGDPAWSPDGRRIAFVRYGVGILVIDPDGKNRRVLWRARDYAAQPHWSPDGRSLSFLSGDYERSGLVTLSATTGRTLSRVRNLDVHDPGVAWSPDGRRIAYTSYARRPGLVVVNRDGTGRRRLLVDASDPAWSPDGHSIAYVAYRPVEGWQVRSMRVDGSGKRRLTHGYPNGGEAFQPAWMRGPVAGTPSPYRIAVSRRRSGAVLRSPFPIAKIGGAGSVAVLSPPARGWSPTTWVTMPPLIVWDALGGRVFRVARIGCNETKSVAVLEDRVGFDCAGGHAASFGRSVLVFRTANPRPISLAAGWVGEGNERSALPGRIAGGGRVLVFSQTPVRGWGARGARRLWRAREGRKKLVTAGRDAGEPAAVDAGRIAVERDDGEVALLRSSGSLIGRIDPGTRLRRRYVWDVRPATVGLAGAFLVVLRQGRLRVYDTSSMRLTRSWRVGGRARLAGVARGLVAYVVHADVHVVRLADGRAAVLHAGGHGLQAQVTSAGLFYAVHRRRVPEFQRRPFRPNPARVVFVPRADLIKALGRS